MQCQYLSFWTRNRVFFDIFNRFIYKFQQTMAINFILNLQSLETVEVVKVKVAFLM